MRRPRLLARTLLVTSVATALLVGAIFGVVLTSVRQHVRAATRDELAASQRTIVMVQERERVSLRGQVAGFAESPTLKAAVDTYGAESATATPDVEAQLLATIDNEVHKIATLVDNSTLVVTDLRGRVLAAAGARRDAWAVGERIANVSDLRQIASDVVHTASGLFNVVATPLVVGDGVSVGTLMLADGLDAEYAARLAAVSGTATAILHEGMIVASTLDTPHELALARVWPEAGDSAGTLTLDREDFAYQRLSPSGDVTLVSLTSIDRAASEAVGAVTSTLTAVGLGALAAALLTSLVLAHHISRPIGQLSAAIHAIARTGDFGRVVPASGSSRELDGLADTFNDLMRSVMAAQADTRAASTAAIRGLAAALDARDRYTAGHSERVSALSVQIARAMSLTDETVEVVRLGALLHDIGKIGVPDEILLKPGPLSDAEYEQLKQHTVLGAKILGHVPFLAPHIPIVELHHEQPDGTGYPYGLTARDIPLEARIVHVADAFDAITSARAYRPARSTHEGLGELWRWIDVQFDAAVVRALTEVTTGQTTRPLSAFPETRTA